MPETLIFDYQNHQITDQQGEVLYRPTSHKQAILTEVQHIATLLCISEDWVSTADMVPFNTTRIDGAEGVGYRLKQLRKILPEAIAVVDDKPRPRRVKAMTQFTVATSIVKQD